MFKNSLAIALTKLDEFNDWFVEGPTRESGLHRSMYTGETKN